MRQILTLTQIAELREQLDEIPITARSRSPTQTEISGPDLLFGRQRHATKQEILAGLPPKAEGDELIAVYFNSMDMSPGENFSIQMSCLCLTAR